MEFESVLFEIDQIKSRDRAEFIKALKENDAKALDILKSAVYRKWQSGSGAHVSSELTRLRDKVLLRVMDFVGAIPDGIDIVAVGGYGRGEMSPFSDIDILILHNEGNLPEEYINQFLYILWDIGYKLGNSVRTIRNVVSHSREDITLLTSLFESRLLAGDGKLLAEMYRAITNILNGFREEYFRTKIEDIYSIYGKVGNSVLLKEPNLKENAGGLRSVHYAAWINFAVNSAPGMEGLRKRLDSADFEQLSQSYDFILHIRNMLHFINNRKEDTLIIDYHTAVANNLGYAGGELDKVTVFMRDYYDRSMKLFLLSWNVIDTLYAEFYKKKIKPIDAKYYLIQRELFIGNGVDPSPEEAFEAVFLCASKKYRPSYNLISFIRNAGNLISPEHRQSKLLFYRFVDILGLDNSSDALNLMKTSDFLYKYIPQFEKIRHYIIYNPFHKYTVDEHSIEGIRMLEELSERKFNDFDKGKVRELVPLAVKKRESMWILKIALLLHDIGKAYPGDHCKNGVEVADIVFREMPLAHRYQEIVAFLIENHLVLSNVSRRADVYNLKTILDFSQRFNLSKYPVEYLEYLYLLTYADIVATNPTNYTGYSATLLYHIFDKSRMVLSGEINEEQWDIMIRAKRVNIAKEFPDGRAEKILATLGEEYMNRHTEEEITEDMRTVLSLGDGETRVSVRKYNEHMLVKIFSPDRLGLFGRLAGILLLNGASIVKANIYTYDKFALDFFYVTEIFGANLSLEEMRNELDHWIDRLNASIADYLSDPDKLDTRIVGLKGKIKGVPAVFKRKAEVAISEKRKGHYLISVSGSDRPALLYDLCRYMATNGISITNALVDTIGWHIRDEFTVAAEGLTDEEVTARHEKRMREIVETNLGEI
jgi:[protein-PII] uridylyltransferase